MDCPRCSVEMAEISGDQMSVRKCGECRGLWIDVADLNRLLLHHNLPGLESLGGRANSDAISGNCPACEVDLIVVEGGEKRSMHYDTCEVCGGIFIPESKAEGDTLTEAVGEIVGFYKRFGPKLSAHPRGP